MELLDLNWEYVLHQHVLSHLSLLDLFQLRAASTGCRDLVHSYFATLRKLDLSLYAERQLSPEAFRVVAANANSLQTFVGDNCGFLTDDQLKKLFNNNRNIRHVYLRCCIQLTPACLQPLIINCKELKVLDLSGCPWLTVGCLEVLALHQRNLEEVHFESCSCLDDSCLVHFFSSFERMRVVCLAHLHSITDRTLQALASHCLKLKHLDISNCSQITDKGIIALSKCPELEVLRVAYCASVGSGASNELASTFDRTHIKDVRPPPPPGWCITRIPKNPGWVFHRKKMMEA